MGEQVSERESLARVLHGDDGSAGVCTLCTEHAAAALAWFAEHRGPRAMATVEEARDHWVAGALWALADQGNEMTPWLVEAVERRAVTEVVFTPTTESEER